MELHDQHGMPDLNEMHRLIDGIIRFCRAFAPPNACDLILVTYWTEFAGSVSTGYQAGTVSA